MRILGVAQPHKVKMGRRLKIVFLKYNKIYYNNIYYI